MADYGHAMATQSGLSAAEEEEIIRQKYHRHAILKRPELQPPPAAHVMHTSVLVAGIEFQDNIRALMTRPARKQAKELNKKKLQQEEGVGEYNIWYHKHLGEKHEQRGFERALTRCVPARDVGLTKADSLKDDVPRFCVHFARGACNLGADCNYLHRCPLPEDDARLKLHLDIFGRERHASHRDDMDGVGCFTKDCRTLYVGGLQRIASTRALRGEARNEGLLELVRDNFAVFGEMEDVRVIYSKSIAFIRYRYRANAEFAKEAMMGQGISEGDVLNVRWAYDDPNPHAQKRMEAEKREVMINTLIQNGISLEKSSYEYPSNYTIPSASGTAAAMVAPYEGVEAYPNTDGQYKSPEEIAREKERAEEEKKKVEEEKQKEEDAKRAEEEKKRLESILDRLAGSEEKKNEGEGEAVNESGSGGGNEGGEAGRPQKVKLTNADFSRMLMESAASASRRGGERPKVEVIEDDDTVLPLGWSSGVDEATGNTYYYHEETGKSQWERPAEGEGEGEEKEGDDVGEGKAGEGGKQEGVQDESAPPTTAAASAAVGGTNPSSPWLAVFDQSSQQYYYFNQSTNTTQWEVPHEGYRLDNGVAVSQQGAAAGGGSAPNAQPASGGMDAYSQWYVSYYKELEEAKQRAEEAKKKGIKSKVGLPPPPQPGFMPGVANVGYTTKYEEYNVQGSFNKQTGKFERWNDELDLSKLPLDRADRQLRAYMDVGQLEQRKRKGGGIKQDPIFAKKSKSTS
eukprot:CAMPEP_0113912798 /NCGR_PEP_ID=MMETSP0780_2-20120614/29149_1 /TAXON_ID=652834 /ORGANISM="Palpitomonas bilix" /LENGTH=741 /DNA_ID=CAMNT_0000909841 /DNA_START=89 /DNA_END=2314 /DNA_ORIENTATION=+ /assembly_acc=CAM_ASM_000599